MFTEQFDQQQQLGLHRFKGSNRGHFYTNERQETVTIPADGEEGEAEEKQVWVYDVYEVDCASDPHRVKNDILTAEHPFGDETKILRKTLARMLKADGSYDSSDFAEFRAYNEFAESV